MKPSKGGGKCACAGTKRCDKPKAQSVGDYKTKSKAK